MSVAPEEPSTHREGSWAVFHCQDQVERIRPKNWKRTVVEGFGAIAGASVLAAMFAYVGLSSVAAVLVAVSIWAFLAWKLDFWHLLLRWKVLALRRRMA